MTEEKHPGGRPPMYETVEELETKVLEYFDGGYNTRQIVVGRGEERTIVEVPVITITGIAHFLGFESRQSFYAYEQKPEFCYIIKRARLFIERFYEEQLQVGNTVGAIFALKNMGWTDNRGVEFSGDVGLSFSQGLKAVGEQLKSQPKMLELVEGGLKD